MTHIVNYIIILLVLINFISDNFKIFLECRTANRAKFAHNSENGQEDSSAAQICPI